ncbi:MAG: hypothetical protein KGL39_48300, partial [Patescibacteria group bacterium]|nr:hypothetical protein [Patescibacteria group bacterium]
RWPQTRKGPGYAERELTTTDGFDILSLASLAGWNPGVAVSNAMVSATLDKASWPSAMRSIGTGQSEIDGTGASGTGFADTDTTKALQFIQSIVGAGGENGLFFIAGNGYTNFIGRHSLTSPPYNTSQATFTDVLTTTGEFQYTDIKPSSDKDLLFNDWRSNWSSGLSYEAIDSVLIAKYGKRTQDVTNYLSSSSEALQSMQYLLGIYKDPLQRVASIVIKPGNYKELWIQCLAREIGDRITVKQHPPGGGQATIEDYTIQGIDAIIQPGPVSNAVFTWSLFPAAAAGFTLDDSSLGVLDVNTLAY